MAVSCYIHSNEKFYLSTLEINLDLAPLSVYKTLAP